MPSREASRAGWRGRGGRRRDAAVTQGSRPAADAGRLEAAPVYLSLGFHDHQPTGNFSWVYAEHYERAYLPFLDVMERHPGVPFSLHLTGPLLLWLAAERPAYLARLRSLVAAGRLELKGGGFYEPILALIPDADKREQLRRMTGYLVEQFDFTPTGAWIAERVWEPHLARVLAEAGLGYAVLDDSHFLSAGVDPDDTYGYYVTEEQGSRFDLFPISKELRYLIPFHEPDETIAHLRELGDTWLKRRADGSLPPDTPPPLAVYDDDGEKFGGWPGTNRHVYENGWLERFLITLERAVDDGWLHLTTLSNYRRTFPPLGRIYIPTGSYAEMLEWSGGFFRNFLVRYDEANLLHKRMLYTSGRVQRRLEHLRATALHDGRDGPPTHAAGGDPARPDQRRDELRAALLAWDYVLRAQCNDPYWHGVFGGLYLPHLRQAAHADLLTAERLLGTAAGPALEILDLDLDGAEEVLLRSTDLVAVIRPAWGGALAAFDHLPSASALLDVLRRRREPEHAVLAELAARADPASPVSAPTGDAAPPEAGGRVEGFPGEAGETSAGSDAPQTIHEGIRMKEPGLERLLFVDTHARGAFLDHFFPAATTTGAIHEGRAVELGDFLDVPYAVSAPAGGAHGGDGEGGGDAVGLSDVRLSRSGAAAGHQVRIEKTYRLGADDDPVLTVTYRVAIGGSAAAALGTPTSAAEGAPAAAESGPARAAAEAAPAPAQVVFAPEVDITLLAGWSAERYVTVDGAAVPRPHLAAIDSHSGARSVELVDQTRGLTVRLGWEVAAAQHDPGAAPPTPAAVDRDPRRHPSTALDPPSFCLDRYGIVTVSQSEDGFERIYQGTALLPSWTIPLHEGYVLQIHFRLEVQSA